MHHPLQNVMLATALLAPGATALAADYEVYYWVDADGVANYSQMAPPVTTTGVSKQVLPDESHAAPEAGEDIYAVEATAREMDALWKGIEERRAEQRKRQPQPAPVVMVQQSEPEEYGFPVWYQRPGRGQGHGPGYGRPGHGSGNGNGQGNGPGQSPNPNPNPNPVPPIMRPPPGSLLDPMD